MKVLTRQAAAVELLGVPVWGATLEEATATLEEAIAAKRPTTVISLNGALLMQTVRDADLLALIRQAGLVIPDGVGVVLAARILGLPVRRRVTGVDLAEAVCREAAADGYRLFLLGAAPGVADAAAARLRHLYPGIMVVGTAHGFFSQDTERDLLERIRAAAPDILLVAFGAPRQERWLHRHAQALRVPVMMGVGGTLDVLAGRVKRAPRWMQDLGLEWLYRMLREPWRWSVVKTIPPLFWLALRARRRGGGRRGRMRSVERR